ncbi:MAG: hypothetical protein HYV63_32480 [Candidatus Schekmanbacteria bacterium]|nr:hypothetical protein [Candidatus Schekmanbacteria bacterium]
MNEYTPLVDREKLDKAVSEFLKVGRVWAKHGLEAGEAALQTTAQALRHVAAGLKELADGITPEQKANAQEAGEAEAETAQEPATTPEAATAAPAEAKKEETVNA